MGIMLAECIEVKAWGGTWACCRISAKDWAPGFGKDGVELSGVGGAFVGIVRVREGEGNSVWFGFNNAV